MREFFDLDAWKKAHALTLKIYCITKQFPKDEIFGVTSQLRRSSSSVAANIAEGFGRFHFKDKQLFYFQARGSVVEVQNFLFLARDLEYIDIVTFQDIMKKAVDVKRLVNGLIRAVKKQI
ncbi:MAG: diversity-generating retroelement protein bAvd family protein [Parcubacteria group bacterium]|nr:diversity-generating retroelement protein bAvd family protein [Parcubacteria group bacterium]